MSMTDTTNFLKRLKGIALSNNERLQMRERVAAYADLHAVSDAVPSASPYSGFFDFLGSRRFSSYAVALLLVVVAGGGVTLGAEGSVPGDSLYSLKISVNEPVMTALAPTATGQAKVAASIATRRVDEAVVLANRGELTPARQTYLSEQFDARIKVADKKSKELASTGDSKGAETIQANLAANLAGEAQALGAVTAKNSGERSDLLRIVVATSERISGEGEAHSGIAVATFEADPTLGSENARATATVRTMLMQAKTGTTATATTLKAKTGVRAAPTLNKYLFVASSTFAGRYASTTLSNFLMAQPKTDTAIPQQPSSSGFTDGSAPLAPVSPIGK